jgi:ATP-binding cassette subfamily B multidrug efflux pump
MRPLHPFTPAVLQLSRPYLRRVGIASAALVVVDVIDMALPLVMKGVFDAIGNRDLFVWFALGYATLLVMQAVLRLIYRTLFPLAQCEFAYSLRNALAWAVIRGGDDTPQQFRAGDVLPLVTSDTEQAACVLNDGLVIGLDAVLYLVCVPFLMIWVSPLAALPALIPLIAVPFIARRGERGISEATHRVQEALTALSTCIDEKLRNHETITLFSLRSRLTKSLNPLSKSQRDRVIDATRADANLTGGIQVCGALAMTVLVIISGVFIHRGFLSIGGFVALYQYLTMLLWPLIALGLYLSISQKARVSSGRLESLVSAGRGQVLTTPDTRSLQTPTIILDQVSVSAVTRAAPILHDISLIVRPGERIAIVGPTGSGKTILLETIASLHPHTGSISFSLDDNGPSTTRLAALGVVALCPQVPRLFSDTIERNLRFWNRSVVELQTMEAMLDELFTDEERKSEPGKPFREQRVDVRNGLSGGQRQRLTLARTLLSAPPIVLLDNPLSALDPIREAQTIALIDRWMASRTLIMVTNRPAALSLANRIIVLREGRIQQDGTPAALRADSSGWFANHFDQQRSTVDANGLEDR